MLFLPDDIIYNIIFMIDFNTIIKITEVNNEINKLLDNNFFKILAIKYYSKEFWKRAALRPRQYSKPLKNIKLELLRIEKFQNLLEKLENKRWTNDMFYNLWDNEDLIYNKNLKRNYLKNNIFYPFQYPIS